jgi:thiamine transport system substrate-binding protein
MVKKIAFVFLPFAVLIVLYFLIQTDSRRQQSQTPATSKLTVYTYSSFASSWGAGVELKKLFLERSGVEVDFVDVGEAGVILQRISLEGHRTQADAVLGLDQFSLSDAKSQNEWLPLELPQVMWSDELESSDIQQGTFAAYNWAPMTFIYRKNQMKPFETLKDLYVSPKSLSLLDPRTSTPGYIFFHWILQKLGVAGTQDFFKNISKSIITVSPSWSAGYGLFSKGQALTVFSYITSPVYHWVEESNSNYQPMYLKEPLPYHMEYYGVLKACRNCKEAMEFYNFLVSPEAQKIIMHKNYMFPVIRGLKEDTEFSKIQSVSLFRPAQEITRERVIEVWKSLEI